DGESCPAGPSRGQRLDIAREAGGKAVRYVGRGRRGARQRRIDRAIRVHSWRLRRDCAAQYRRYASRLIVKDIIAVIIEFMAGVAELFALAVEHHRAGRFNEATVCYRRVLELNPEFTEAYNNLGTGLPAQRKLD